MNLIDALKNWDGVHVDYLQEIYQTHQNDAVFFEELITITKKYEGLQTSSTWLIKHHYDQKQSLKQSLVDALYSKGIAIAPWEAKLHLLQILPKITINSKNVIAIDDLVRAGLTDETKFVRAWSYQGLYELAKFLPEYENELRIRCEEAMQFESASILSKVRKILAAIDKNKK